MTRTQAEISEMLKEFGAVGQRWTDTGERTQKGLLPRLEFLLEIPREGAKLEKMEVRIDAKATVKTGRNKRGRIVVSAKVDPDGAMRMVYWHLRNKLIGIRFGLEDTTSTFFSNIVGQLPDGQTMTFQEIVERHPEVLDSILPDYQIIPRLTAKPPKDEILEATVSEVQKMVDEERREP